MFVNFFQRCSISKRVHYSVREPFPVHPTCDFSDRGEERRKKMCEEGVRLDVVNYRVDLNNQRVQATLCLPSPCLDLPTFSVPVIMVAFYHNTKF